MTALKELTINNGPDDLQKLTMSSGLSVTRIILLNTIPEPEVLSYPNLKEFRLQDCAVTPDLLQNIAKTTKCDVLELSSYSVNDDCLKALVKGNLKVKKLIIERCNVTEDGVNAIKKHIPTVEIKLPKIKVDTTNKLNHILTGGSAKSTQFTSINCNLHNDNKWETDNATDTWLPQACLLCDVHPDDETVSVKKSKDSGSTWIITDDHPVDTQTGVLVVDLCNAGDFDFAQLTKFIFYQMGNSDGLATHVRISTASCASAPTHLSPIWKEAIPWSVVDNGEEKETEEGFVMKATNSWTVDPIIARYVKIEAKNDGRHGKAKYIEVRQIKAF